MEERNIVKELGLTQEEAALIVILAVLNVIKNAIKNTFKKHPIIFITVLLSYLLGIGSVVYYYHSESIKNQDLNEYQQKIENKIVELESLEKQLSKTKSELEQLKLEDVKLNAIVNVDRQIADALFIVQEERSSKKLWIERFYSFLVGILSSASFAGIYYLFTKVRKEISNRRVKGKMDKVETH